MKRFQDWRAEKVLEVVKNVCDQYDFQFTKMKSAFPNEGRGTDDWSLAKEVPNSSRWDLDIWDAASDETQDKALSDFCEGRHTRRAPKTVTNTGGTYTVRSL